MKLILLLWCSFNESWGIATCKGIQDSLGFRIPRHGFQIPGTGFWILSPWNLDSGFQSLEGLRIPWDVYSVFQSLILILENDLIIVSNLQSVKPVESKTLWALRFQSLPNLVRFTHLLKMTSASVQHCSVVEAGVAKTCEMSLSVPTIWSHGFSLQ